jgi:hypothetical protein
MEKEIELRLELFKITCELLKDSNIVYEQRAYFMCKETSDLYRFITTGKIPELQIKGN